MPEILVLWVRFTFCGACLESLHLVVNEMGWCDLTPVCNELESSVKRDESQRGDGESANHRGPVRAGHAMYRDVVSLFDVRSDLIKRCPECLMSVGHD